MTRRGFYRTGVLIRFPRLYLCFEDFALAVPPLKAIFFSRRSAFSLWVVFFAFPAASRHHRKAIKAGVQRKKAELKAPINFNVDVS